jgi:hypothetical protein
VYVHIGPADLPVAEFTTDADVAIGPELLAEEPSIHALLEGRGFELQEDPGKWRPSVLPGAGSSGWCRPVTPDLAEFSRSADLRATADREPEGRDPLRHKGSRSGADGTRTHDPLLAKQDRPVS